MPGESSFDDLLDRLRRRDDDAATHVFQRYAGRLLAVARGRLNPVLRQKTDPEDVLQSAFRTFFHHVADGDYELIDWESLWGLLVVITLRKCHRQGRHYLGAGRDVRKEQTTPLPAESSGADLSVIARDPGPEEAAILTETLEELLRGLDERDCRILQLRLQGHTAAEVGDLLGYTQFTVEAVLKKIRKRWSKMRDDA